MVLILAAGMAGIFLWKRSHTAGSPPTSENKGGSKDTKKKDAQSGTSDYTIELQGDSEVTVRLGDPYEDAGAVVKDRQGNRTDISVSLEEYDLNTAGEHQLVYKATFPKGKEISAQRTVTVTPNKEYGAKVVSISGRDGFVYDPDGIELEIVQQIKEVERGRIKEYVDRTSHKNATYTEGCKGIWSIKCDIALPCATQNEIDSESAKLLAENGCFAVSEGANMPSTPEAIDVYFANNMLYGPAKAANAGGVATSGLEMSQNSERLSWTFEEVDSKLHNIMKEIFKSCDEAAKEFGMPGNYMAGANIAGFLKVAEAMKAQGCC